MLKETPSVAPWFRPTLGLLAVLAGMIGLLALYWVPVPQSNMQALMLGLGIVLGWGSAVIQSEYGSSSTSKKLADKVADAVQTQ